MLRAMDQNASVAKPASSVSDEPAVVYRVFVRDLVLPCSIGIYPHEKGLRRRVRINSEIGVASPLPRSDDFADVVNYETIVAGIKAEGITTIIVEQNAIAALELADRAVILDMGEVVFDGGADHVLDNAELRAAYLAV